MFKPYLNGNVLLISTDPEVRRKIRLERSGSPMVCLDTISSGCNYLKAFSDVDFVYLDGPLLTPEAVLRTESEMYCLRPKVRIIYLFTSIKELERLSLPLTSVFRLLETAN